jgi:hypothetical protein
VTNKIETIPQKSTKVSLTIGCVSTISPSHKAFYHLKDYYCSTFQPTTTGTTNMAPFSKIEQAIYYDDSEEEVVSLDGEDNSLVRKSSSSSIGTSSIKSASSSSSSSVSFATDVAVYAILHINDYSLAERRDSWYGVEEMRQVRQEWKSVVQAMEYTAINSYNNAEDNDESSICVRGLEGKTYTGKQRRREARSASLEVVLNEQWYQGTDHFEGSNNDPITIAMAYHELTYPMQVEAYQKAQKDAQVVGQSLSAENDNVPRKFDFRTVRAKYFAHNNNSKDDEDSDATIMTCANMAYNVHNASNLLLYRSRNDSLRKRLSSCLLPLTPKRYARSRYSPTGENAPKHLLAEM